MAHSRWIQELMKQGPAKISPKKPLARTKVTHASIKDRKRWVLALAAIFFVSATFIEWHYALIESRVFAHLDRSLTFWMEPGPSTHMERAGTGPYDERLGIANLNAVVTHLQNSGYDIAAQARVSPLARTLASVGLSGIYHEKTQAGLRIEDRQGTKLFEARYPQRIYPDYRAIPPLVVKTLLFIENRQLQNASLPRQNPAIEWTRTGKAVLDLAVHTVDRKHSISGGSTLATQLEKMRHSPGGQTGSVGEKIRQVAAASLRSYLDGTDTREVRQQIIRDYVNSIPLAATPSQGEIFGLADGLSAWYGADFHKVNQLLRSGEGGGPRGLDTQLSLQQARAYRQVLSLFLAMRAPGWYLIRRPDLLKIQTDRYLRALASDGVISLRLRDLALISPLHPRPDSNPSAASARTGSANFVSNKAQNAIRST